MLKNILEYISYLLKPSTYLGGMDYVMSVWRGADSREKIILLLVFAPMFIAMCGLLMSVVYFILFVLPLFLFRMLGWGFLTALFGLAGKFGYKYFTGREFGSSNSNNIDPKDVIIDVKFEDIKK